jgi:acyl-CoA thioesterase
MTPGCDRRFFALNVTEPGHASVVIPKRLLAPGGRLYGGSILALSFAMMEQHSKRPAVWCAAQMVSPAKPKELLMLSCSESRSGRRTAQLRVVATMSDREVFCAVGSTGTRTPHASTTFAAMPAVSPPEDSPPPQWNFDPDPDHTYFGQIDLREASVMSIPGVVSPAMALWARIPRLPTWSAPKLAYVADLASTAIAQAAERAAGTRRPGASLDSSLRVGPVSETEWALVAAYPDMIHGDFAHGTVQVWDPAGPLLAIGSQTFGLRSRSIG